MGITSTMFTALSGLDASQARLDVAGNNIANVNTTGFKGSRSTFETQLSRSLSFGSPPSAASGGTNPMQLGLGVGVASIDKDMGDGAVDPTGVNTHMAIQGGGFFVLQKGDGSQMFTRDGSFRLDETQKLVNSDGFAVMGYGVDSNFGLVAGSLTELTVPVGRLSISQATTQTNFSGTLNSSGVVSATPSTVMSEALVHTGGAVPIVGSTALTAVSTASVPTVSLFADGDVLTLSAKKGGRSLPDATFTVTDAATSATDSGATVDELTEWLEAKLGINSSVTQTPAAQVTVNSAGEIEIVGNLGPDSDIEVKLTSSGAVSQPVAWTATEGDGTSTHTSFQVYDSLGNPVNVNMTFTLVEKSSTGNTWRFYAESPDDSDASPVVGTGTIKFDTTGFVSETSGTTITINRADTGAVNPLSVGMNFSAITGLNTDSNDGVRMTSQDGFPVGTLNDFAVGGDGTIKGLFSNGQDRTMGQVVLATFSNPEGLIDMGSNTFVGGPNSGTPAIVTPGNMGSGQIMGRALELSNVDITKEFVNIMTATTAFSSSGRVISTSQQLLAELLQIVR